MAGCIGWIIAAFFGGYLVACVAGCRRAALMQNFSRVEHFAGRSLREIIIIAGRSPSSTVVRDGMRLVTWRCAGYSITLSFDEHDVCHGVIDEKY